MKNPPESRIYKNKSQIDITSTVLHSCSKEAKATFPQARSIVSSRPNTFNVRGCTAGRESLLLVFS